MNYMDLKFHTTSIINKGLKGLYMCIETFDEKNVEEILENIKQNGSLEAGFVKIDKRFYFYYGDEAKESLCRELNDKLSELENQTLSPEDEKKYNDYVEALMSIPKESYEIGF